MGHDTRYEKIRFVFLKRRFYLGLFVFLPLFFTAFALAAPLIFFEKLETVMHYTVIDRTDLLSVYRSVRNWMYLIMASAFISGLLVAYGLVRPAKKLLKENTGENDIEEFSSLGKEFTEMATYLRKYTSLLESTTGGIMAMNKNGEITMANPHACRTFGFSGDIAGKNVKTLLDISKDFDKAMGGDVVSSELIASVDGENRTIGYTLSPIKGREGADGVVFSFKDITGMKEIQTEIRKTERLASIGTLAMEVAHEIKNPLASIKGLAQLIGEDLKNDSEKKAYIDIILKETDRLNRVVDTLFRKKTSFPEGDSLKEMIHRIVFLCGQAVRDKAVRVREEYGDIADKIEVKDERLFHAIYNIVLNAYEAVRAEGEIIIAVGTKDAGPTIEISSDSELGFGINADRIFEPDITTKGKGHGMGLKIAKDAIKNIGGTVSIETSGGKTKFVIRLP